MSKNGVEIIRQLKFYIAHLKKTKTKHAHFLFPSFLLILSLLSYPYHLLLFTSLQTVVLN